MATKRREASTSYTMRETIAAGRVERGWGFCKMPRTAMHGK